MTAPDRSGAPFSSGRFHNPENGYQPNLNVLLRSRRIPLHLEARPEQPLPARQITAQELTQTGPDRLYRLGHSTVLLQLDGHWLLTDPVFSERASPVAWAGPVRFGPAPVAVDQLPAITAVVISHDHYDHLDKASVVKLDDKVSYFVVPLKVGRHLQKWGIAAEKIIELDWWQGAQLGAVTITATPAQHYSGRGAFDRYQTLWAGFVLESTDSRVFFSGDSGYFSGFARIGQQFGRFDVALLEAGAYNSLWRAIHLMPLDVIRAGQDLNASLVVPVHNGTFNMARHAWWEPFEALDELGVWMGVSVAQPRFGEPLELHQPTAELNAWWRAPGRGAEPLLTCQQSRC